MINFKINLMMRWMDLIRHVLSIVHKKTDPVTPGARNCHGIVPSPATRKGTL